MTYVLALGLLAAAVVLDVDAALLELLVEVRDFVVAELEGVGELVQLGDLDAAGLGADFEQRIDRICAHQFAIPVPGDALTRKVGGTLTG